MNALTVVLALFAAFANAAASVLMRRAATEKTEREEKGDVGGEGDGRGADAADAGEPGDAGRAAEEPHGPGAGERGAREAGHRQAGDGPAAPPDGPGADGSAVRAPGGGRGPAGGSPTAGSRAVRARRRRFWLAGAALLAGSAVLQAAALAVGSLSLVQPLLATELLFTLMLGSVVFHWRPDRITWLSFLALAAGLALFLGAAAPSAGRATAEAGRWIPVGIALACLVTVLLVVARLVTGPPRAAVLGLASAVLFAVTAALLKEVTGLYPQGLAVLASDWTPYATAATGLAAFGLLQLAFHAGTLVASQPALTLGDAVTSVALGVALFGEEIALGVRLLPEAIGIGLLAAGTVGLARSPAVSGKWDTEPAHGTVPGRGRAQAEHP
ncbi:DMT family transporter [Streptomyces kebangsaanensis]|uniref:DMT family transporter n=1 Tax=Streptomyces kebangsaanensis TaxID=864058 RepID=UPI001F2E818E|nr:DMT family transporter [Streptomyces kebangsaanensis]